MKLGFDLDEVVVNLTAEIEKFIVKAYGIDWSVDRCNKFYFGDIQFHHEKEINDEIVKELSVVVNDPDFQSSAEPVVGAVEALNHLKRAGHKLHFITSRPKRNQSSTFKWLRSNNIPFDSIDLVGFNAPKGVLGPKYNLDMYVDDLEDHLKSMLSYKKRWKKGLILFDRPWNEYYDGSKFLKLSNWQEIIRHVGVQNR